MPAGEKRALVTGGSGFVGSRLVRRLLSDGWLVHAVVRPGRVVDAPSGAEGRLFTHVHDGTTESLEALLAEARPDVVFHLASLFLAQHEAADVAPLVLSNVLFGTQLAEAMARTGACRLVNAGTSWQHFGNADYDPVCLYAATKQAFEDILAHYVSSCGLRVVTLKLFDTYGPEDPRPKLFTLLGKVAASQQPLAMSPGDQMIDLVYIDDVVDAFLAAAGRLEGGSVANHERYAVSSGRPIRLRDLVALYGRVAGVPMPIEWGKRPYRPREVMTTWDRGNPPPGWAPKVGLEDGIARMLKTGK
jgi:nucleoside-diphosphate-sugar epimerase